METLGEKEQIFLAEYDQDKYVALYHLSFSVKEGWESPALLYLYHLANALLLALSKTPDIEWTREKTAVSITEEVRVKFKEEVPYVIGMEYVDEEWMEKIWVKLNAVFCAEIEKYQGTVEMYFTEYNANLNLAGKVFFHLVETKDEAFPFAFMATYSTKPVKSKKAMHMPLKNALSEFGKDEKKLLTLLVTVTKAAEQSTFISNLMESGELFLPLKFTANEAYEFLREIPVYEDAGILCRVPNWWRKKSNRIQVSAVVGQKPPSQVGLDAMMDFSPTLSIDGEAITFQELEEFLKMAEGLTLYKGKWVEINKTKLEAALLAFERVKAFGVNGEFSMGDALRMQLTMNNEFGDLPEEIEVSLTNGQWLQRVKETLLNPKDIPPVPLVPTFRAALRPYQKSGYQWLHAMAKLKLGACLADDMGLGKTVQMIAFLEYTRVTQGGKALLILPASLIGNWQKELSRFAPELPFQILHKSEAKLEETDYIKGDAFLYITTYGMAVKLEELNEQNWDVLILDESQAIKNAGTKQSKAIKAIPATMKIAMTGTPIENHLGDLWSLFDFLNKGLLGSAKEFTTFTKQLTEETGGYGKLRKTVSPFILRRLKTDKTIIEDLPDKIEMKEYAALTKRQIGLYQELLKEITLKLKEAEGIQRKGVVLSSIMKFKQICNHPAQYLGQEEFKPQYSGKFQQLAEICETIYEKHERVLVFTQFKEMTQPLSEFLQELFHKEGFVLHGGTPIKNRQEMVEKFNGEAYVPYMVLSLKAGGVGLNLTGANHVVHFDRWWNPAVENQATDRAFRIGQTKNVMVHKFVTKGTIEEKIDAMMEEKQKLAGDILASSGEKWITELDNKELLNLFQLGGV
ncbi:MAG: DEAD/DEAH box helicase [Anaerovorax sp.]